MKSGATANHRPRPLGEGSISPRPRSTAMVETMGVWLKRIGWYSCGLAIVLLYGDSLLHLAGSLLHIVIEVLELALEHFLEHAFGLTGHRNQMLTAWIGLSAFLVLGVVLFGQIRKAVRKHVVAWAPMLGKMRATLERARLRQNWPKMVACGMGVAALYVFLF